MLTAMHTDSTYTSPSSPAASVPPHHLRAVPAGRRIAKRRPRPSRRLPTTYIRADPANFRHMVHQVTGADNLPPPSLPPPARASSAGAGALLPPTLDTSAFLLGRAGPTAWREAAAVQPCDDSAGSLALVEPGLEAAVDGVGGAYSHTSDCGFPTLESWGLV